MNAAIFAEFLARQGHTILQTESCYWYDAQPGFYFYFPYHRLIEPSAEELRTLRRGRLFIGARFFVPPQTGVRNSYLLVCDDKNYSLDSVDARYARRQTRRGLEHFEIRRVEFADLAESGLPLVQDTLTRQGRSRKTWDAARWRAYCLAADGLDGFEAWGAYREDQLAAFMITFLMEDHFTILHHSSATEFLPLYSNNALVYWVTKQKLSDPRISCVFYGPESLDAPESLDKFKFRMGFTTRPMDQKIVFNPLVKPLINPISQKMVQWLTERNPGSDLWRKLNGIIGFYRHTARPLEVPHESE